MRSDLNILWVASGPDTREDATFRESLGPAAAHLVRGASAALEALESVRPDAVVANFPMPDCSAAEFLLWAQRIEPATPVIIRDRTGTIGDAVRLTRLGAWHFFGPPFDAELLSRELERAVEDRRSRQLARLGDRLAGESWRKWLVGDSRAMQKVAEIIRLVGGRRCTVLITGETGTGKEIAARALHAASPRGHLPMVTVNCGALPENLLEAELFGHVKGAFTGAVNQRIGRFEQAHGSTLFLDEIGEMAPDLQVKLLRVLQEREFQRLGSSESIRIDVRVVAASNADLTRKIEEGRFREDLYYRLNVVPIEMPPLRERLDDVSLLARHFLEKICGQEDLPVKHIARESLDHLAFYAWPGNVRQLENVVEMAVALSGDRPVLYPGDFRLASDLPPRPASGHAPPAVSVPVEGLDYERTVDRFERHILEQALHRAGGNKKKAADLLRLKRTTLSAKLRTLSARASG